MQKTKVEQFNNIKNQFIIYTDKGKYFQSHNSVIVFIPVDIKKKIQLGPNWNYSTTTSKYRSMFLKESLKITKQKLNSGEYILNENL